MEQIDLDKEKKKNIRLAIIIGAVGIAGFMAMYFIFLIIMFLSPYTLFSLMPLPSISTSAAGINEKLFIFSEEIDFKGASFTNEPKEKTTMRTYESMQNKGGTLGMPVEIKPFHSLAVGDNKIYFFDKGLYRVFDGKSWEEVKNPAIGESPKAAISAQGIWVLSKSKNTPLLKLLYEDMAEKIPLPEAEEQGQVYVCSSSLQWFNNRLYLFWENNNTLFLNTYQDGRWSRAETLGTVTSYHILAHDRRLLLFTQAQGSTNISLQSFNGQSWSAPKDINIKELTLNFHPAVFKGMPVLLTQGFFSKRLYTISRDEAEGPFTIQSPLKEAFTWKLLLFILIPSFIYLVLIFVLSVIIGKYKLRFWRTDSTEVEFASLFRRFLAKTIDSLIIPLPMALYVISAFQEEGFPPQNPFWIFKIVILFILVIFIGGYLYHSILEGTWGKTLGKKLCGITVVRDDFTKCTIGRAFLRNLLRIVDSWFYYLVGVVSMTATLKWQRLGDIVSGTAVIKGSVTPPVKGVSDPGQ